MVIIKSINEGTKTDAEQHKGNSTTARSSQEGATSVEKGNAIKGKGGTAPKKGNAIKGKGGPATGGTGPATGRTCEIGLTRTGTDFRGGTEKACDKKGGTARPTLCQYSI